MSGSVSFVNWVQSLVTERMGLHGWQGTWELLIDQAGRKVTLDIKPPAYQVVWTSAEQDRPAVKAIVRQMIPKSLGVQLCGDKLLPPHAGLVVALGHIGLNGLDRHGQPSRVAPLRCAGSCCRTS
jgi:hypothetical protein